MDDMMNKKILQQKQQMVTVQQNSNVHMQTMAPQMDTVQHKESVFAGVLQADDVFAEKKISKNSNLGEKIAVLSKEDLVDHMSEYGKKAFQEVLRLDCQSEESTINGAREEYKSAMSKLTTYSDMELDSMSIEEQKKAYADVRKHLMSSLTKLKYKIRIENLTAAEKEELQKQIDVLTQFRTEFETAEEKFEENEDGDGLINYLAGKESFRNTLRGNIRKNYKSFYSDEYDLAMKAVSTYANMNLDKTEEREQAKVLLSAIHTVDQQLEVLKNRYANEQDKAKKQRLDEEVEILTRYKLYFETTAHGALETENLLNENNHLEFKEDKKIKMAGILPLSWKDVREMPLFSHQPTVDDIKQGCLGDCYLEAALVNIVVNNPEKIKECIRDNGNGTVTVRFLRRIEDLPPKPLYVTVKKTIPAFMGKEHYSYSAMWAQMIQKAYAASGIHNEVGRINEKKREIYDRYSYIYKASTSQKEKTEGFIKMKSEMAELTKSYEEFTFDEKFCSYKDIVGGSSNRVMSLLTGEKSKMTYSKNASSASITKIRASFHDEMYAKESVQEITESERDKLLDLMACVEHIVLKNVKKVGKEKYGPPLTIEDIYEACCSIHLRADDLKEYKGFLNKAHLSLAINEDKAVLGKKIKRAIDSLWPKMEKYLEELGGDRLEHRMFETKKDVEGNIIGKYTPRALGCYDAIKNALEKGIPIGVGTQDYVPSSIFARGLNGESMSGGIVERHAYSILGVKEIDGHKYILMRNPWKSTGVGYKKITIPGNGTNKATVKYKTETVEYEQRGQFLLELNEFMTRVDCYHGIW